MAKKSPKKPFLQRPSTKAMVFMYGLLAGSSFMNGFNNAAASVPNDAGSVTIDDIIASSGSVESGNTGKLPNGVGLSQTCNGVFVPKDFGEIVDDYVAKNYIKKNGTVALGTLKQDLKRLGTSADGVDSIITMVKQAADPYPALRLIARENVQILMTIESDLHYAQRHTGIDAYELMLVGLVESRLNPFAASSTSTAGGITQFLDGSMEDALRVHFKDLPPDEKNFVAALWGEPGDEDWGNVASLDRLKHNARLLFVLTGLEMQRHGAQTARAYYIVHFAGPTGAEKLQNAEMNAIAALILPKAAAANESIFFDENGKPRTVEQVFAEFDRRFDAKAKSADTILAMLAQVDALVKHEPNAPGCLTASVTRNTSTYKLGGG